jgi:hypothetical protein
VFLKEEICRTVYAARCTFLRASSDAGVAEIIVHFDSNSLEIGNLGIKIVVVISILLNVLFVNPGKVMEAFGYDDFEFLFVNIVGVEVGQLLHSIHVEGEVPVL